MRQVSNVLEGTIPVCRVCLGKVYSSQNAALSDNARGKGSIRISMDGISAPARDTTAL